LGWARTGSILHFLDLFDCFLFSGRGITSRIGLDLLGRRVFYLFYGLFWRGRIEVHRFSLARVRWR
jgi:hypothetical protein